MTALAISKGFSSWEVFEKREMERFKNVGDGWRQEIEEKAASLGKTFEEVYVEDP